MLVMTVIQRRAEKWRNEVTERVAYTNLQKYRVAN